MKTLQVVKLILPVVCIGAAAHGQVFLFGGINSDIPDGDLSGLVNAQSIVGLTAPIASIQVGLTLGGTGPGAVNGDYYVTLEHNGITAVLLNRPGLRSGSLIGYDDNGFDNVTFDDAAPNGDVHSYRLALSGDHEVPIDPFPSPLTGMWAPDGRNANPLSVQDTDERNSMLSAFNGMEGNGTWTLFLVDVQTGATGQLNDWSLHVQVVPEPATMGIGVAIPLLGWALWRRHSRLRQRQGTTGAAADSLGAGCPDS